MQLCTAVWLHVKLHLVLPQVGTESLRRISVGFWCITTSRDGEGRIQTGRGFLALLSTLMGSPTREASPPCSQWRNTTSPHYITLAEAPKEDLHPHVPDMTDSSCRDTVMVEGGTYFVIFRPSISSSLLLSQWDKLQNDPVWPALKPAECISERGDWRINDPGKTHWT